MKALRSKHEQEDNEEELMLSKGISIVCHMFLWLLARGQAKVGAMWCG